MPSCNTEPRRRIRSDRLRRTRKEQKRDRQKHFDCLEKFQDSKAHDTFMRPAYQAGKMVQEQGRQIERSVQDDIQGDD